MSIGRCAQAGLVHPSTDTPCFPFGGARGPAGCRIESTVAAVIIDAAAGAHVGAAIVVVSDARRCKLVALPAIPIVEELLPELPSSAEPVLLRVPDVARKPARGSHAPVLVLERPPSGAVLLPRPRPLDALGFLGRREARAGVFELSPHSVGWPALGEVFGIVNVRPRQARVPTGGGWRRRLRQRRGGAQAVELGSDQSHSGWRGGGWVKRTEGWSGGGAVCTARRFVAAKAACVR